MNITRDVLIGDLVTTHPEVVEILLSIGMHCLGCPGARMESLADACAVHGVDVDAVIEKMEQRVADYNGGK